MRAKVLVVDDDSAVRMLIRLHLESDPNFEVVAEAAGCEEAVEAFREFRPDVVTMDHQMPGEDGVECIKKLRAEKPDLPVLAVSSSGESVLSGMLAAGAYGKLDKAHVAVIAPALRQGLELVNASAEPSVMDQLRDAIERLEREAAAELDRQRRIIGKRVDLVAALNAIRVALDNPAYSPDEAITCIRKLTECALAADVEAH